MRPVFGLWIGGPLTRLAQASIRSFIELGHPYTLYAYEEPGPMPARAVVSDAGDVLRRRAVSYLLSRGAYSMISNLFRYRRRLDGGLWVDTDVIALRPFDFPLDETIVAWQDDELMNGAVLGAPHNDPFIRELHRRATSWRSGYAWSSSWPEHGRPAHFRRALRHGQTYLLAEAPWGRIGPETYAVHAWNTVLERLDAQDPADGTILHPLLAA
jgi:hypothetical protein